MFYFFEFLVINGRQNAVSYMIWNFQSVSAFLRIYFVCLKAITMQMDIFWILNQAMCRGL